MKTKTSLLLLLLLFAFFCPLSSFSPAVSGSQSEAEVISQIKTAISTSSARELLRYCSNPVEISLDNNRSSYSTAQAEFVLKDFFSKHRNTYFNSIHQGSSRGDLIYLLGKYGYNGGSFQVYILLKKQSDKVLIDFIDFSKQ